MVGSILDAAAAVVGRGARPDVFAVCTDIQAWGGGSTDTFNFNLSLGPEHPGRHIFLGLVNVSDSALTGLSLVSPDPEVDPADLRSITRFNEPVNIRWYSAYFPQGDAATLTAVAATDHSYMGVVCYAVLNREEYFAKQVDNQVGTVPGLAQSAVAIPTGGAVLALSYSRTSGGGAWIATGCHLSPQAVPLWPVSSDVADASAGPASVLGVGAVQAVQVSSASLVSRNLLSILSVA